MTDEEFRALQLRIARNRRRLDRRLREAADGMRLLEAMRTQLGEISFSALSGSFALGLLSGRVIRRYPVLAHLRIFIEQRPRWSDWIEFWRDALARISDTNTNDNAPKVAALGTVPAAPPRSASQPLSESYCTE